MRTLLGIGLIIFALLAVALPVTGAPSNDCQPSKTCVSVQWGGDIGGVDWEEDKKATGVYVLAACAVEQDDCNNRGVVYFECNGHEGLQRQKGSFGETTWEADCRVVT